MRLVRDGIIIGAVHRPALPGPQSSAAGSSQGLSRCQELFSSLSSPLTEELIKRAFIIRSPNTAEKINSDRTITDAIGFIIKFIKRSLHRIAGDPKHHVCANANAQLQYEFPPHFGPRVSQIWACILPTHKVPGWNKRAQNEI